MEPWFGSVSWGCYWWEKEPATTAFEWLAGWAAPPVWWGREGGSFFSFLGFIF
jgi:hypothetical protein